MAPRELPEYLRPVPGPDQELPEGPPAANPPAANGGDSLVQAPPAPPQAEAPPPYPQQPTAYQQPSPNYRPPAQQPDPGYPQAPPPQQAPPQQQPPPPPPPPPPAQPPPPQPREPAQAPYAPPQEPVYSPPPQPPQQPPPPRPPQAPPPQPEPPQAPAPQPEPPQAPPPPPGPPPPAARSEPSPLSEAPLEGDRKGIIAPRSRGHSNGFLTDVIVELGFATQEQVAAAVEQGRTAGRTPEQVLVEQGIVDAERLSRATAERYGLDFVDLAVYTVDMGAANLVSVKSARRHQAVPVGFVDEQTLLLAMADPANVLAIDDVQMSTGYSCQVAVAPAADVDALISRLTTLQSTVAEAILEDEEEQEEDPSEVTDIRASADDAPVIKLVNSILGQAVTEGASDIHFQAHESDMRIRFRIDGVLQEAARVPKRMVAGVVSRIKIMSELDIAEKRIPQDGRVGVTIEDRRVDLRVTTLPTQRGEGATVRILDEQSSRRTLDDLGMQGDERHRFETSFKKPYGAILVTGPTGSGKSTTLYAALQELNNVDKNIVTIEDPVEYRLDGVNQIGVHRKAGLTFATGLRSVLRADPDVIMVGEVRDAETARIAIEASLTGHMLLTTLHTNDAPGAITRLNEMGIESFLTSSAVDCVVAQRLARVLCPHCKRRAVIAHDALVDAGFRVGADLEAYEPVGCPRCHRIGYRGRVGVYSVMVMSERIKEMVVNLASEAEIGQVAREEGMLTLRESGLAMVRAGVTSIEEVARVAS